MISQSLEDCWEAALEGQRCCGRPPSHCVVPKPSDLGYAACSRTAETLSHTVSGLYLYAAYKSTKRQVFRSSAYTPSATSVLCICVQVLQVSSSEANRNCIQRSGILAPLP